MELQYLWLAIPVILLQFAIQAFTLMDCIKQTSYKTLSRPYWIVITLLFGFLGVIAYFVFGKES